jgi:hypothetical protein
MVAHPKSGFPPAQRLARRTKNPSADFLAFSAAQSFEFLRHTSYPVGAGCQLFFQPSGRLLPPASSRLSPDADVKVSESHPRARVFLNYFHFFLERSFWAILRAFSGFFEVSNAGLVVAIDLQPPATSRFNQSPAQSHARSSMNRMCLMKSVLRLLLLN